MVTIGDAMAMRVEATGGWIRGDCSRVKGKWRMVTDIRIQVVEDFRKMKESEDWYLLLASSLR